MKCSKCGSRDIDFQESIGQSICVNCGTVLEENTIVSSIEFQESGDRSHVVGQYISASCSKPYSGGRPMGGHGENRDPRDATLVNARRAITQVAGSLRLPPLYIDRAYRLYQLALQRNFIFGRKQLHVVATCLYIICRQEKSPHLLIDFSDALQINVYVLGKSFLQFSKVLNLNLPVVDPSLYIHRYATRLDLGDSRASVVATSLRIITRLKKDWITTGRRPDGICALAMLVAARAHSFDVNQDVICKLFRVSPDLLRRRIEDFRSIPSAQLTLEQFHTNDAEVEYDPPSFIRNVVRDAGDIDCEDGYGSCSKRVKLSLPSATAQSTRAQNHRAGTVSSALVDAVNLELGGSGKGEAENTGHGSDSEGGDSDDENNVMRNADNLISDDVFQDQSNGAARAAAMLSAQGNSEDEDELYKNDQSNVGGKSGFVQTKIADISITVPVPGAHKRRKQTDNFMLKVQQRKDLYEDVYQDVLQNCEQITSAENMEALQKEAQTIEDATRGVGGWGEQSTRIRERRIILCVDNASMHSATTSSALLASSKSSGGTTLGKIKFRKLNNGADSNIPFSGVPVKSDPTKENDAEKDEPSGEGGELDEEELLGGELSRYLLSPEEQQKRTMIWEKAFRPFMDERESRRKAKEREQESSGASEKYTQGGKLRRKYTRKAIAAAAAGGGTSNATTASQAVMQAQHTRSSKKINYDALKGVFNQDGTFADPTAASSASLGERTASQAYLQSLMGMDVPGMPSFTPTVAPTSVSAVGSGGSGFQKDLRKTVLGSSIAKTTSQRGSAAGKEKAGGGGSTLLTAGGALSAGGVSARGVGKLGPPLPASTTTGAALSSTAVAAPAVAATGYNDDALDDEGEEDQLLYEAGGGDEGDYDDYDDEYY